MIVAVITRIVVVDLHRADTRDSTSVLIKIITSFDRAALFTTILVFTVLMKSNFSLWWIIRNYYMRYLFAVVVLSPDVSEKNDAQTLRGPRYDGVC